MSDQVVTRTGVAAAITVMSGALSWVYSITTPAPSTVVRRGNIDTADACDRDMHDCDRRTVEVGTLIVQRIEAERDGPCRDINFDPTVLPSGMRTSDDPFPAARSAAYAKSYDRRTAEAADYPRTAPGARP